MLSSLRTRITLAMASLVSLLAVASAMAMREVATLETLSHEVADIDEATRRLQHVATAMRDAYAHQAHIVILDDRSHLDHYSDTHQAAVKSVVDARAVLHDAEDLADLVLIERAILELDASFRRDLLPSIPGGRGAGTAAAHDKAIRLVESAQATADRLTRRFDERAASIRAGAAEARDRLFGRCVLLFGAAAALALVVAVLLDRQVSAPVRSLANAAQRLGDGDLTTRVVVDGDHELARLARHFNEMAQELEERQKKLLEAERLASVGRLAAGVAHEINNPLGVMLGYVRLIEKRAVDDAVLRDDIAMVGAEIQRCQLIVSGLLDLARPPRLNRVDVDVVALVNDAAQPLQPLSDGSPRVRLRGASTATALLDEGKTLQIVRNLFQNAIDAAPDAAFDVEVAVDVDDVVITVADRGAGLSEEARARMFEPFFTSKPKGTGLGLAVSRAFAEAQAGSLAPADTSSGAAFVLRLPRHPPDRTEA